MARQGKKNRPLACTDVFFKMAPKYDKGTNKFVSPLPIVKAYNAEVLDEEDGEMGRSVQETINLQAQIDAGMWTIEEVAGIIAQVRQMWDNQALLSEEPV